MHRVKMCYAELYLYHVNDLLLQWYNMKIKLHDEEERHAETKE